MLLSHENRIPGTIRSIQEGAICAYVQLDCGGVRTTSLISMQSLMRMGIRVGDRIEAIFSVFDVEFSDGPANVMNAVPGIVVATKDGSVDTLVSVETDAGFRISGVIPQDSAKMLGLTAGKRAVAIIRPPAVGIGIEG